MYLCILNQQGETVFHRNIKTRPDTFLYAIKPFREDLVVSVECMFSWYWLADLCEDHEIPFILGHALYMRAIHGGKSKNDRIDSKKVAALLRGGLIPQAYVYPRNMRSTRDLLRRRNHFMRKRAELFSHTQNTATQYNFAEALGRIAKPKNREGLLDKFDDPSVKKSIEANMEMIKTYDRVIGDLERSITKSAVNHDPIAYALLKTIPGVGRIIALDILYEIATIHRFPRVQDFVSYSRLVKCAKESNGKLYGSSGKKFGNAHLCWAFSLTSQLFLKGNDAGKRYHQKLVNKHNKVKALSILAHKLGRAVYFILKNQRPFDMDKFLNH